MFVDFVCVIFQLFQFLFFFFHSIDCGHISMFQVAVADTDGEDEHGPGKE